VLHRTSQDISDGLNAAMRMPGKSGKVVLGDVVAEIVEQEKWIEVLRISEAECALKMHTSALKSGLRLD
jgi:hypothetical protein